ncbi:BTAD domain-containing putative transcriptional regulator [Roseisolibacter agri]|uniref:Bacterial transcriptional activator domain-containing protein n=1 Tax=Roseisolibacter agri TaxID=2014610 RepID=A0AA37QCB9_9BACT|nr:BTAD domain-containing putative transcriptional regulator [Roseisolibacter agri]GLC24093.1 hypothetical protein rosag_06060 [Roseisolibacter agri]
MLYLRTFGRLTIERDGHALDGAALRRRPLTLLAFVASHGDVGVSRECVLAAFWPASDAAHARNSLKQSMFALRRELGVDVLVPGSATLRVDRRVLAVDALDLADALDRDDLPAALALYQGPFLDGVPMSGRPHLERWAERERERFAYACGRVLETMAARATASGDRAAAIAAWRRRAALDPLSGQAAAGLMRALRDAGDTTAALDHWRVHDVLVRTELGVAPDPQVVALAEALRAPAPVRASDRTPSVPRPDGRRWRPRRHVAGGMVVGIVAALVATAAVRVSAGPVLPHAEAYALRVAVLPFTVRGMPADADASLGQGVADLVSGAVHDADGWSAVPPTALLADEVVSARPRLTARESRDVARRFGAGRFILGDVVRDGARLHLAASLHDADGRVLAQAHTTAADGQLGEACAAIARALLAPRTPETRAPR